jgi:hypothetical protein
MRELQQEPGRRSTQITATRMVHRAARSDLGAIQALTSARRPGQHSLPREAAASDQYGCVEWFAYEGNPPAPD